MKHRFALLIGFLCCTLLLNAQITLRYTDYPTAPTGADSLKITTTAAAFPSLTPAAGGLWDLSAVTDSAPVFFAYRTTDAAYTYADSNQYQLLYFPYQGNTHVSITATGILEYGVNVKGVGYNLSTYTVNPHDSIFILPQDIYYSTPHTQLALPATYLTTYSSGYQYNLQYELTYTFGVTTNSHVPGIVKSYITEADTITGWGQLRVKDAAGNPSAWWQALQVQTTTIKRDSFFLNGAPMPGTLLTTFGIVQGRPDTTFVQQYYRPGELTPLAEVAFRNAGYTQPYKATTHTQRLVPENVPGPNTVTALTLYPNPLCNNGSLRLTGSMQAGNYNYCLYNNAGKKVGSGIAAFSNNEGFIPLPAFIVNGFYSLQLYAGEKPLKTMQLQVCR